MAHVVCFSGWGSYGFYNSFLGDSVSLFQGSIFILSYVRPESSPYVHANIGESLYSGRLRGKKTLSHSRCLPVAYDWQVSECSETWKGHHCSSTVLQVGSSNVRSDNGRGKGLVAEGCSKHRCFRKQILELGSRTQKRSYDLC